MAKKVSNKLKNMNMTKANFFFSLVFAILFLISVIGTTAALIVMLDQCQEYVNNAYQTHAAWLDEPYKSFNDVILHSKAPTYYDMIVEKGVEGFSWFYLTSYKPAALAVYISLPLSAIGLLVSFGFTFIRSLELYHPSKKQKKNKKKAKASKKGGK